MKVIDRVLIEIEEKDIKETLILNDIDEIAEKVFEDNQKIKVINAPDLKKIGVKAFYNCANLAKVNAPNLEEIEEYAFFATSITDFCFDGVLTIGKNAFENTRLTSIVLPKSLKKLGKYAFSNNRFLQKVKIESLMTRIKEGVFQNCIELKEVIFSNAINKLGIGVFKNCRKLNNIELPEHLKIIEVNCFWECESLKKIVVDDELEFINDYAFGYTKIDKFVLKGNIKNVGRLPFHMCSQLESLELNKIFNDEMFDKTNPKLKEITINGEKVELLKQIQKIVNYNNLVVIKYVDESFQIISKPTKYYSLAYFKKLLGNNAKLALKCDAIFNIYYWESILGEEEARKLNPISFIALPPNINMIKAYSRKHKLYDELITDFNLIDFIAVLSLIKFVTIFGGLNKKNNYDFKKMISQIGIKNIIECFKNVEVKEFNQKFTDLYKKLSEKYSCKEICNLMPFLYNNIEKVTNLQDNITLDDLESIKFESENTNQEINIKVVKEDKGQNYEWLDTTSIVNLLWGYILASVAEKNLDVNEDVRKVLTYHIKDEEGLIVATARAYYSSSEKYLLFNSLTLSQSFINKGYSVEKIKSLIIDYVLAGIEDIINFFNKEEVIISKVNVGISEKSIKEQIANRGTKIISEKI